MLLKHIVCFEIPLPFQSKILGKSSVYACLDCPKVQFELDFFPQNLFFLR